MLGKIALFSSGATIFVGTAYVVGLALAPPPTYKVTNEQRINKFDEIAAVYEAKTKKQEFYLGIGRWRRKILKEAEGRVLEVGAGTGSNVELYPADKCDEVIFCDRAPHMVDMAIAKIRGRLGYDPFYYPTYDLDASKAEEISAKNALLLNDRAVVVKGGGDPFATTDESQAARAGAGASPCVLHEGLTPISEALFLSKEKLSVLEQRRAAVAAKHDVKVQHQKEHPTEHLPASRATQQDLYSVACFPAEKLPFPNNSFDTVVDMFGLCSFDDPVRALTEMSRVCKPDGKILLLEHGKGTWEKMNGYLDKWAPRHACMWGCWWNRDIRRYIRLSGVALLEREEKHYGTSHYMVLKPYKSMEELKELEKQGIVISTKPLKTSGVSA